MTQGIAASPRCRCRASRRGEAGRLRFFSSNLAGCSLARIVEEELIAVGIIDHQKPVAPRTLLDRNALGLEFAAQRVQRGDRGLARLPLARPRLDVQGNEHQRLSNLLGPLAGKDERAALALHLGDERLSVPLELPGAREAEPVNVKAERSLNIRYVQDGACKPVCHRLTIFR